MRLAGSKSQTELRRLSEVRKLEIEQIQKTTHGLTGDLDPLINIINGRHHLLLDDALHKKSNGPYYLSNQRIATIVLDALKWMAENNRWFLYAACIMGNHLHAVVRAPDGVDEVPIGPLVQSVKRHTGRQSNLLLDRTGTPFWSPEYYDRDVRRGKFTNVIWYVLNNPVAAGLCDTWRDWEHVYLHPEYLGLFNGLPAEGL